MTFGPRGLAEPLSVRARRRRRPAARRAAARRRRRPRRRSCRGAAARRRGDSRARAPALGSAGRSTRSSTGGWSDLRLDPVDPRISCGDPGRVGEVAVGALRRLAVPALERTAAAAASTARAERPGVGRGSGRAGRATAPARGSRRSSGPSDLAPCAHPLELQTATSRLDAQPGERRGEQRQREPVPAPERGDRGRSAACGCRRPRTPGTCRRGRRTRCRAVRPGKRTDDRQHDALGAAALGQVVVRKRDFAGSHGVRGPESRRTSVTPAWRS